MVAAHVDEAARAVPMPYQGMPAKSLRTERRAPASLALLLMGSSPVMRHAEHNSIHSFDAYPKCSWPMMAPDCRTTTCARSSLSLHQHVCVNAAAIVLHS